MSTPDLSMFFVVDPPRYQDMGCYLAASIRTHLDEDVDLIGYCPADTIKDMDPYALAIFKKLKVDIRPMDTQGAFDPWKQDDCRSAAAKDSVFRLSGQRHPFHRGDQGGRSYQAGTCFADARGIDVLVGSEDMERHIRRL